ncbi:glycoside hydrolase family 28 protein [Edaphobacter sp.]|uniref:glycoside hydrolase family 28 protein n=1 Tax=Edaphobacter sp. TaxID=1934404 RepID=UPI002DB5F499|nr:glycosyl hydrolase family 28 protein [Edaphobacter sp.]HEU5339705.1 glycosyl hydrolase family 28 protein [Edaphobacter sp.]
MKLGAFAVVLVACVAVGQDTRVVKEPVIPTSCVRIEARLATVNNGMGIASADEGRLDTARIQAALDTCGPGKAVELAASDGHDAFLTGPLEMRSGVTLVVDKGVTLFGSRDAQRYEWKGDGVTPGLCGTIAATVPAVFPAPQKPAPLRGGCRPLISIVNAHDVGIMGDGVIDGRGYAKILGKDYSWWEMARKAEPKNERYFTPRMIVASHADGLVLYRITLHNSTNYHVSVNGTNGFTAWGVHLLTPTVRGMDARNTDGIDPGSSTNITIAHSWIDNGDDNIAIKTGVTHMSVLDNHFYSGHGMSIGSETFTGDSYILVDGLTEDHTTSGIRIKSNVTRGGLVHDLVYQNICMRGVKNPIAISPYYTNQTTEGFVDPGYTGTRIPDYKKIVLKNVTSETPGDVLIAGLNDEHRTEIALDRVFIRGIKPEQVHLAFADIMAISHGDNSGAKGTNIDLTHGQSVKVIQGGYQHVPHKSSIMDYGDACAEKFVPMQ